MNCGEPQFFKHKIKTMRKKIIIIFFLILPRFQHSVADKRPSWSPVSSENILKHVKTISEIRGYYPIPPKESGEGYLGGCRGGKQKGNIML